MTRTLSSVSIRSRISPPLSTNSIGCGPNDVIARGKATVDYRTVCRLRRGRQRRLTVKGKRVGPDFCPDPKQPVIVGFTRRLVTDPVSKTDPFRCPPRLHVTAKAYLRTARQQHIGCRHAPLLAFRNEASHCNRLTYRNVLAANVTPAETVDVLRLELPKLFSAITVLSPERNSHMWVSPVDRYYFPFEFPYHARNDAPRRDKTARQAEAEAQQQCYS
jgi:hypothetical protein